MAKNLVNGTNVVIEENGDNISMNLSSAYNTNLQQEINDSFKENNIYSTTETVIGTWINNKPIYRKVFDRGTSIESFAHNISNISNIWINNDYSVRIHASGNCIPLNGGTSSTSLTTSCYVNSTTVTINVFGSSISPSQVYVTLEYTKTTD